MIKCPKCGYEMLPEPKWIQWMRKCFDENRRRKTKWRKKKRFPIEHRRSWKNTG
jgi:hypothetical protein